MWEDVLKVQIVGSKQKVKMGNIPIPTEDEDDCKRWLKGLYDVFKNNETESIGWSANPVFKSERIPEEESCAIKHYIENQPADKIYRYRESFSTTSIILRFDAAIVLLVSMGNGIGGEEDLRMNLLCSWSDLSKELSKWFLSGGENKPPLFGAIKEICKYINRKDVWEHFKKQFDEQTRPHNESLEIMAKMQQMGELDW